MSRNLKEFVSCLISITNQTVQSKSSYCLHIIQSTTYQKSAILSLKGRRLYHTTHQFKLASNLLQIAFLAFVRIFLVDADVKSSFTLTTLLFTLSASKWNLLKYLKPAGSLT